MQHCQNRSDRYRHKFRETSPVRSLRAPDVPTSIPGNVEASSSFHQSRSNGQSLQEASVGRRFQGTSGSLPFHRSAPELAREQLHSKSLGEKAPLEHIALEGETTKLTEVPPPTPEQLDSDKLELGDDSWIYGIQLAEALADMQTSSAQLGCKAWWARAHQRR